MTAGTEDSFAPPGVDPAVPSPARMWNFWLGGKDNFASDRAAAAAVEERLPSLPVIARQVREFQVDAVGRLVRQGVRQFVDIGTGLPVAGSTHEVAQRVAPESRVVYVDNDPMVLAHARALLTSTPEGDCAYIDEDLRNPAAIMAKAAQTLDLSQPVAVLLVAVLHFVADAEDPWAVARTLVQAVHGDTYLAVIHAARDVGAGAQGMAEAYNQQSPVKIWPRDRNQVEAFFEGMQMLSPGLVALHQWLPSADFGNDLDASYAGIGVRPARG